MANAEDAQAARGLFHGFSRHYATDKPVLLLSRKDGGANIRQTSENEFFWNPGGKTGFWPECPTDLEYERGLRTFLDLVQPDIVHVHPHPGFNYALLEYLRQFNRETPIYLTFQDYHPVCPASSRMLAPDGRPCENFGISACARCAACKGASEGQIWQRKRRFQHFLSLADAIITPSNYMQNIFLRWGVEANRIHTLENCVKTNLSCLPPRQREYNRFVFIGEVCPASGLQAAMRAMTHIEPRQLAKIRLTVLASSFNEQPDAFKQEIGDLRTKLENSGNLAWRDAPDPDCLPGILAEQDWLIAPSFWGESSPAAIQLAKSLRLPVICSGHASLAEMVAHDVNGVLVGGKSPVKTWEEAFNITPFNEKFWSRLSRDTEPPNNAAIVADHLRLFGALPDPWDLDRV